MRTTGRDTHHALKTLVLSVHADAHSALQSLHPAVLNESALAHGRREPAITLVLPVPGCVATVRAAVPHRGVAVRDVVCALADLFYAPMSPAQLHAAGRPDLAVHAPGQVLLRHLFPPHVRVCGVHPQPDGTFFVVIQ
jgi:hypothetical protein